MTKLPRNLLLSPLFGSCRCLGHWRRIGGRREATAARCAPKFSHNSIEGSSALVSYDSKSLAKKGQSFLSGLVRFQRVVTQPVDHFSRMAPEATLLFVPLRDGWWLVCQKCIIRKSSIIGYSMHHSPILTNTDPIQDFTMYYFF